MIVEVAGNDVIRTNITNLQIEDHELAVFELHSESRSVCIETADSGFHMANAQLQWRNRRRRGRPLQALVGPYP
ncbi:hypothetical protein [Stagnimonas aquatica]|uniref:hypothetical protein n=1 Tax=Stagnimonas aquatica TaxID=2689987 RepID=UPI0011CD40E1|nr:hypothetical protein [Stagnimonas aquatica]